MSSSGAKCSRSRSIETFLSVENMGLVLTSGVTDLKSASSVLNDKSPFKQGGILSNCDKT